MRKRKQSCMDSFLINKLVKECDRSDTLSEEEDYNSELVFCSKKTNKVKKYRLFTQKYDQNYLKYGFVSGGDGTNPEPTCRLCAIFGDMLSNDEMKPSQLIRHLHSIHLTYKDKYE